MITTTLRGENVFLLPFLANWSHALTLSFSIESNITRSLGGMESREARGCTLRAGQTCSLLLRDDESEVFRAGLRHIGDKRVLMPMWPLARRLCDGYVVYADSTGAILTTSAGKILRTDEIIYSAPPPIITGLWLTMEPRNVSIYEVHEATLPQSSVLRGSMTALRVPLMLGYFDELVEPSAITRRLLSAEVKFVDSAPVWFAPRVEPAPVIATSGDGRSVFPFSPNWEKSPTAGGARYEIKREEIGSGRTPSTTYYPQIAARTMQAEFNTFSWDDLARLTAFFQSTGGAVESFYVQHVLDGRMLARFAKTSLEFDFISGRIAQAKIGFLELPHELAPPDGETPGKTFGPMERTAQLFRFIRRYPGGTVIDRFTDYECTVTAGGEIFKNEHIEHDDIVDSLEPDKTKVKLKARAFEGNPLMLFSPNRLEVPLEIEILEATPDADGNAPAPRLLFVGRVGKPEGTGPILKAEATHWLADLQRNVPDMLVQDECNHELFGLRCKLRQEDWTFRGTVVSYDNHTLTLGNFTRTNGAALPAINGGWFAFGRVWFGVGSNFQTRTIGNSTAITNGVITLTIAQPFDIAPGGDITLIPGCAGTPDACAVFGNYSNFGGFPYVPVGNPALKAVKDEPKQGKK